MTERLSRRVEELRADYAKVRGQPFEHFFCPILLTDEPGELCEGHIVPEDFGNLWIPQRKDVDNFYGSATEADTVGMIQDKETDITTNWHTPSVQRRRRPTLEADGKPLEYYFSKKPVSVPGHSPAVVVGQDGEAVNVMFKLPIEEIEALEGKDLQLVVNGSCLPHFVGTILKAAHLSMFDMLGYDYVFTPTGQYVAHILRKFFLDHRDDKQQSKREAADEYFGQFAPMCFPLQGASSASFAGTVNDKQGIFCVGMSEKTFAVGIMVKMSEVFCALLPPDDAEAIGTYQGFLKEPPPSVLIRDFRFQGSKWRINKDTCRALLPRRTD